MAYRSLDEIEMSEIEKGGQSALAFRNDDVATLSWHSLSVKVADRATGKDKSILSEVSGHVRAGAAALHMCNLLSILTDR